MIHYIGNKDKIIESNEVVIDLGAPKPEYIYIEENGIMKGLKFSGGYHENAFLASDYFNDKMLIIMAFVTAQEEHSFLSDKVTSILKEIEKKPFESFEYDIYDVKIKYTVELSEGVEGLNFVEVSYDENYRVEFEMYKD